MPTAAERHEDEAEREARQAERIAVETEAPVVLTPQSAGEARQAGLNYMLAAGLALAALALLLMNVIF